jgi:hypothetical protein
MHGSKTASTARAKAANSKAKMKASGTYKAIIREGKNVITLKLIRNLPRVFPKISP